MSLVLGEALSMGRNMARLAGRRWDRWRCGHGSASRRSGRGAGMGTRRRVRRWLGWVHRRIVQCVSSLIVGFGLSNSWIFQWDDFKLGSTWNDQGECGKLLGQSGRFMVPFPNPIGLRIAGRVRRGGRGGTSARCGVACCLDKALTQSYDDGCVMRGRLGTPAHASVTDYNSHTVECREYSACMELRR